MDRILVINDIPMYIKVVDNKVTTDVHCTEWINIPYNIEPWSNSFIIWLEKILIDNT